MIPLKLSLRNFMSYGDNVAPLDFSGIHLACLSGDNGHGKSALLDAITWALWGQSRAGSDDELIRLGADEMHVEFEFMLGDSHYRVIRKRQKRKSASIPSLEIFVRSGDAFRPMTGNSIADSEQRIVQLLSMDYPTFINSAFLRQGHADEFTVKPPGKRKEILADILGLGAYDQLEAQARERAKSAEAERKVLAAEIQGIDNELANETRYHDDLQAAQADSARLSAQFTEAEERIAGLRQTKNMLDAKASHLKDMLARLERAERDIAGAEEQASACRTRIAGYEATLSRRTAIDDGYAGLLAVRGEGDALNQALGRLVKLQDETAVARSQVDGERSRLQIDANTLQARLRDLTAQVRRADGAQQELDAVRAALDELQGAETQLQAARQVQQEDASRVAALRHANETLRADMVGLKNKIDTLAGVTHCPLCNSPLSDAEREQVRGSYTADGQAKGEEFRRNEAEVKRAEQALAARKGDMSGLEARLAGRPDLHRREASLEKTLADAQSAAEQAAAAQERLATVSQRLAAGDFAVDLQRRLRALEQEMAGLAYDRARHEEVRSRLAELAHFESEKGELETAARLVDRERLDLKRLQSSLAVWTRDLAADRQAVEALKAELADLPAVTAALRAGEQDTADLQARAHFAREAVGAARQKLDHCTYLRQQRTVKSSAEETARRERSIYEELAAAFGKKGIQAMIIEQAIPEIEEEANRLLTRMTDGRMNVKFETQRSSRQGDVIETLDIKLADELGTRSYEMYSGGEAFRANFAIRIALSRLLARRAGARLQTLVIDEGFGTQDSRGRERLVEAITSIAGDFEMILVITHIEELKDAFPIRIEVTKSADGSQIAIT
jgi:exonuclease SbcC